MFTALLGGCGSGPSSRPAESRYVERGPPVSGPAKDVLFTALALVGTPYRYGGNNPSAGFDCSGLVGYVYREAAAVQLPRSTREIADVRAKKLKRDQLRSGDLVLFGKGRVDHIGIYVGEGRFVHAPSTGGTVRLDHLDGPYWRDRWAGGKRLL
jgi:cell wall-associated NlpC family hydrolase